MSLWHVAHSSNNTVGGEGEDNREREEGEEEEKGEGSKERKEGEDSKEREKDEGTIITARTHPYTPPTSLELDCVLASFSVSCTASDCA